VVTIREDANGSAVREPDPRRLAAVLVADHVELRKGHHVDAHAVAHSL